MTAERGNGEFATHSGGILMSDGTTSARMIR